MVSGSNPLLPILIDVKHSSRTRIRQKIVDVVVGIVGRVSLCHYILHYVAQTYSTHETTFSDTPDQPGFA